MNAGRYSVALALAVVLGVAVVALTDVLADTFADSHDRYMQWQVHDQARPKPPVVTPGGSGTQHAAGTAPSDAIVLFDGSDLKAFSHQDGEDCQWVIRENAALEVTSGVGGDIYTRQAFGDCQLHLEWMAPEDLPDQEGQARGNSGVFLMGEYEIQILDCYENESYADGMAGAVYGQAPALANACRPRGQWQTYDIIFRRPHFDEQGRCVQPATVTVLHNGVLVQDHTQILGPTRHHARTAYQAHDDALPIQIQDHGDKLRLRNIWIRELTPRE